MVTTIMVTTVGIRELKESAPEFVGRAERGERIVITRYGKPVAVLAPTPAGRPEQTPKEIQWEKERATFEKARPRLERKYAGRYVAWAGGKIIADGPDHEALYQKVAKRLGDRVFYIARVGSDPPIVDMPGFELDSE